MKRITKNILASFALVLALQSVSTLEAADPRQWRRRTKIAATGSGLAASVAGLGLGLRAGLFSDNFRYLGWVTNIADSTTRNVVATFDELPEYKTLSNGPVHFEDTTNELFNHEPFANFNAFYDELKHIATDGEEFVTTTVKAFSSRAWQEDLFHDQDLNATCQALRTIHDRVNGPWHKFTSYASSCLFSEPSSIKLIICIIRIGNHQEGKGTMELYSIDNVDLKLLHTRRRRRRGRGSRK